MATIARSVRSASYHRRRDVFAIVGPADARKSVDEPSGQIERVIPELSSFVIPREHVVEVVPALA